MADLKVGRILLGEIMTNGYFLYREGSDECIFADPGDSGAEVVEELSKRGLSIKAIILTHGHYDHMLGVDAMREKSGAKVYACDEEKDCLENPAINLSGNSMRGSCSISADIYMKDGEETEICGMKFRLIHTPGHTKGGCCYYFYEDNSLICGDTLFEGSVGRTDFPGGSMSTLVRSIKEKLFILPEDTICYPGHGEATTIKEEKQYNPFLQ